MKRDAANHTLGAAKTPWYGMTVSSTVDPGVAVGGSCDGGSLWYSRIAREGAGMVWIRRELPRTIRREFGLGLIA